MTTCTRCEGSGFVNMHQCPEEVCQFYDHSGDVEIVQAWIKDNVTDCQVCDCCGNGESWYGTPGEHYNREDPRGHDGPYRYNGGLCECH